MRSIMQYGLATGASGRFRRVVLLCAHVMALLAMSCAFADTPVIGPITAKGATWAWLGQDGTDYFDLHHNADDTLDKIDPQALAQNVAAYTVFAYLAAEADGDFGSVVNEAAPAPAATR